MWRISCISFKITTYFDIYIVLLITLTFFATFY
jgi:hypothetical protein